MFTGIIKELGSLRGISGLGNIYKLSIEAKDIASGLIIGDSVSVNGACLTLTEKDKNIIKFDVMAETMRKTTLGKLKPQDLVNLEDALKAGGSIGGHFVTGHIDCVGRVKDVRRASGEVSIDVTFPEEYSYLVVDKGSIALDGISLTIGKVLKNSVTVYIIPHTLKITTLGAKRIGDEINIEFDIIGKYVANNNKFEKA
ncbi:MAG: riboflavin synthase [Candidatus Omnitrophota bacterium]|nr:riboflavin synthase [Candidatus Omnitrophota bacterium]